VPSINMIAARRADKKKQEQNIRRLVYAIAGEVGGTLVIISILVGRMVLINGQISDLQHETVKLKPTVASIQNMQQETQQMQPEVATLAGAHGDTMFWYDGFYAVTSALPPQSWLTALSTSGAGDAAPGAVAAGDPQLTLSGNTTEQSQVETAILQMNQLPGLDHVYLSSVTQEKVAGASKVTFQMTVHLKPEVAVTMVDTTPLAGGTNVQKS
jgi:Tfp pilus assembly protein PilN